MRCDPIVVRSVWALAAFLYLGRGFGRNQKGLFALIVMGQDGNMAKRQTEKVHDRRSFDLPINAEVAIAIVDDPYSKIGEKITIIRSIHDDPLIWMLHNDKIDQAQFEAGRKWQEHHENSEIGPIQAIDPAKTKVDGGRMADPLPVRTLKAFNALADADKILGPLAAGLMRDILGKRMTISEAACRRDFYTKRAVLTIGDHFKWGLEQLATHWGYSQGETPHFANVT